MNIGEQSLELHRKLKGKIELKNKYDIQNKLDLSLVYTPGVASSCMAIHNNVDESYNLTSRGSTVAVISDGTAVLGLGDIGPYAAMPVMEGKCAIFKRFAGVDAIPIVLDTKDTDELVKTIAFLAPSFGGINLEDISAPRCFEVERRLKEMLDIPVFHDDQHGTAIVTSAALLNALKLTGKSLPDIKIVVNGAGSAGIAISKFLLELGAKNIIMVDRFGIVEEHDERLNSAQREMALITNLEDITGDLETAMHQADVFIGVSTGNIVSHKMIQVMNENPIIFALANPVPEISREDALLAGVSVYGSGASNQPNQINNALVFPGLFKGALEARVKQITTEMEIAACYALSNIIPTADLRHDFIIPDIFNMSVSKNICEAIKNTQEKSK